MHDAPPAPAGEATPSTAPARRIIPAGLGEALALFLPLRAAFSLFALILSFTVELPPPCWENEVQAVWQTKPRFYAEGMEFRLLGVWERWDGCWYQRLATFGYERDTHGTAFFPLYPGLVRGLGAFFAGNLMVSALVVSAAGYITAIAGLYRLVRHDFDEATARRTVLYLSIFPSAFFLFAPFTEALFLAVSVWAVYAARTRQWAIAGAAALLAGLTRIQGVLLALPLAWEVFCCWRERRLLIVWPPPATWPSLLGQALVPLAPFLSLLVYLRYSEAVAGMSPLEAQRWWGSTYHAPWTVVSVTWRFMVAHADAIIALNLAGLFLFAALAIVGLRRLPFAYTLYTVPPLLLAWARLNPATLVSTTRYALVLFPAFVVLALLGRRQWFDTSWLILSLLLLGALFSAFLQNVFVA